MTQQAACTIKLPVFEGPFDLLYHLVKKAEIDIWSVSIAAITEQYLAYLKSMQELNLDIASEFLVMAATLLRLKSKMLLPRPPRHGEEEEEDDEALFQINSPEELFERLEEYRRFKEAAGYLGRLAEEQQKIYLRSTGKKLVVIPKKEVQQSYYTYWEGAQLLGEIMNRIEAAAAARSLPPVIELLEDLPVNERSAYICRLLEQRGPVLPFNAFLKRKGIWELLVTLVSLLELARLRKVILLQERHFGPILVRLAKENDHGTRTVQGAN
ncbi:MAG: segregation/condensation protein A [Firmicutes bacterium]|mgnify:CR=1 FL=1|jgi:segregation and condensation protein A|nr:segregation/condensation protein A [Bacillota bacterium]HPU00308.1 segregation/condensation protein A [Bacillota bacterium]